MSGCHLVGKWHSQDLANVSFIHGMCFKKEMVPIRQYLLEEGGGVSKDLGILEGWRGLSACYITNKNQYCVTLF